MDLSPCSKVRYMYSYNEARSTLATRLKGHGNLGTADAAYSSIRYGIGIPAVSYTIYKQVLYNDCLESDLATQNAMSSCTRCPASKFLLGFVWSVCPFGSWRDVKQVDGSPKVKHGGRCGMFCLFVKACPSNNMLAARHTQ